MDDINVGDLVMIVRWPHEHVSKWGVPGVVSEVVELQPKAACPACGQTWSAPAACLKLGLAVPVSWLRKLPSAAPRPQQVKETGVASSGDFAWRGS